ncbi:MAG: hypothetical protein KGH67_02655 [Candidatus Micrarchaeota archaeon]|nr:hypothetical protein [Candidatus Micrarchaeota archaeon]MDE1859405.1 hypothetical protein [Candidatus Micrarchaeota archaeon]
MAKIKVKRNITKGTVKVVGTGLGISKGMLALILLGLLIVIGIIYLGTSGGSAPQFPKFANTNGTVPQAFSQFQGESGSSATQAFSALVGSRLSNLSQFTILYSGRVYLRPSGAVGTVTSINSPLYMSNYRYGQNSKFILNVSSVPVVGMFYISEVNTTNSTYVCANFDSNAVQNGQYQQLFTGSHQITCSVGSSLAGLDLNRLVLFNFTQLSNMGIQFDYNTEYQSSYNNQPCTFVAGTVSSEWDSSVNGLFQMCISDVYYAPLSFSISMTSSQGAFAANLNETSITNSSSLSYVTSLPGQVV